MSKVYVIANTNPTGFVLYAATANKELAESVYKKLKMQYRGTEQEQYLEMLKFSDEHALALMNDQEEPTDVVSKRKIIAEEYPRNLLLSMADLSLYSKGIPTENVTDDVRQGLAYSLSLLPVQDQEILRLRFEERKTLRTIGAELGYTGERIRVLEQNALSLLLAPPCLDYIRYGKAGCEARMVQNQESVREFDAKTPLEELGISGRSLNSLKKKGYDTVADILPLKEKEITSIRNLGAGSIIEIAETLTRIGAGTTAWSKFLPQK